MTSQYYDAFEGNRMMVKFLEGSVSSEEGFRGIFVLMYRLIC
jgi:hypothetical protein